MGEPSGRRPPPSEIVLGRDARRCPPRREIPFSMLITRVDSLFRGKLSMICGQPVGEMTSKCGYQKRSQFVWIFRLFLEGAFRRS